MIQEKNKTRQEQKQQTSQTNIKEENSELYKSSQ